MMNTLSDQCQWQSKVFASSGRTLALESYAPQQKPAQIVVDDVMVAAPSTFAMVVDSKEDGDKVKANLESPEYQWILEMTRVSGRITRIVSMFPNAPIEEVLTADQLSYIKSQLS